MDKRKHKFITDLLESKKITVAQKERVMKLAAKEMGSFIPLEKRVQKIEGVVFKESAQTTITNTNSKLEDLEPNLPKYIDPYKLYNYLFEYNQNKILRHTCHDIDANAFKDILDYCGTNEYNFQIHLKIILNAFEEHDKNNFAPSNTKSLIRGYLTGKKYNGELIEDGWSSDDIMMNWCHRELTEWCNINELPPNSSQEMFAKNRIRGFDIKGFNSKLFGKRVQNFRELVLHFKSLFHIRFDNSLFSIISIAIKDRNWTNVIEFEMEEKWFPKNIELFTDVDKLIQAYNAIMLLIIEQHSNDGKPKVKLTFYEKGTNVYLSIHHLNNIYKKSKNSTIDRPLGEKYSNIINNLLNGVCNLYLRADFGNGELAKINIWNGKEQGPIPDDFDGFNGGVEHIFEFCKK